MQNHNFTSFRMEVKIGLSLLGRDTDGIEMRTKFWSENLKGRDNSKELCLKDTIREIGCKGVDWTHLVQNKDQWRSLVNTVMKFRVP